MNPLEIILRLCDVTETLSAIVKEQQTIIEQSAIGEAVKEEIRSRIKETDRELDAIGHRARKLGDLEDAGGKERTVDD